MNENNYYVLSWNSEYLSNAILAGPVSFEEAGRFVRDTAIERIGELGIAENHDTFAEHLYDMAEEKPLCNGIDDVKVGKWEVCLYYAGQEERISIVQYDQKPSDIQESEEGEAETATREAVQTAMENGTMIYSTSARCPRCHRPLYTSDIPKYPLVCPVCDENFYYIEVRDFDSELFETHIPMDVEFYMKNRKQIRDIAERSNAVFVGYDDVTGIMDIGYKKDDLPSAKMLLNTLRWIEGVQKDKQS